MSNYFRKLPNLDYPSLLKTRKSNLDFVQTKNLFQAMLAGQKVNLKMRLKMEIGLFKKQEMI